MNERASVHQYSPVDEDVYAESSQGYLRFDVQGSPKLVAILNQLLDDKLMAISLNMLDAEKYRRWGYDKLHAAIERQMDIELHNAELLIRRILFLGGTPALTLPSPVTVGQTVLEMVRYEQETKQRAIRAYKRAIGIAHDVADQATANLLTEILKAEEGHAAWTNMQRTQMEKMGTEKYLAVQTVGARSLA